MKRILLTFAILLAPYFAVAQTTYTTTQDGCGGKNLGYCLMNVNDQTGTPFQAIIDHRVAGCCYIDTLTIQTPVYPHTAVIDQRHGTVSGFVANPDGSRNPYYGSGSYVSDDGTITSNLNFYAYYVATCSGRGCAGATVGWHYKVLTGSTITVQ